MAANNLQYPPVRTVPVEHNVRESTLAHYARHDDEDEEDYQHRVTNRSRALHQLRCFGIGDNRTNYQRWLEESPVYRKLIFEKVNIPPFTGPIVIDPRAAAAVYFYSIGRLLDQKLDLPGLRRALACAEFLMPMINEALIVPEQEAQAILVSSVRALLRNSRKMNQEIRNLAVLWTAATTIQEDENAYPLEGLWDNDDTICPFGPHNPLPDTLDMTEDRLARITPREAMIYLLFLASHYPNTALPVEMLATVYVACAKQGQITGGFSEKIENGVQTELGIRIDIDSETVNLLYTHFGKNFDETTAEPAFNRWQAMLPDSALRLRLTIEQITFSRLTVYKVIEEAVNMFFDFPWPLMNKLLPGELPNYVIAANLIDGNPYYGFRKNIGEAASTRYKNLGWVAKELLIKGAGKGTLANYQGWPRNVPHQERLARIIREYLQGKAEVGAVADADLAVANDLLASVVPNFVRGVYDDVWRPEDEDEENNDNN
uniref:Nucleocapsid protein n=1 Tax=Nasutitermes takasagoensis chuvirus 1 TaxID=3133479 RepID=A0AAT9JPY5_9VIRU